MVGWLFISSMFFEFYFENVFISDFVFSFNSVSFENFCTECIEIFSVSQNVLQNIGKVNVQIMEFNFIPWKKKCYISNYFKIIYSDYIKWFKNDICRTHNFLSMCLTNLLWTEIKTHH